MSDKRRQLACLAVLLGLAGNAQAVRLDPLLTQSRVAVSATAPMFDEESADPCRFNELPATLELTEAIERALCHNPQTHAAWATARAQAALLGVARSAYLPSLGASFGYARQKSRSRYDDYAPLDSDTAPKTRSGSLKMSWTLADSGLRSANLAQANALLDAANASHDLSLQNAFVETAQAYFDAQTAKSVLRASREAESSALQSHKATQAKYAAGVGALTDKLQAEVALSDARLKRITAEGELKNALGALLTAMGQSPTTALNLPERGEELPETGFVKSADELLADARQHHPALLAARAELQAAQARVDATRAEGRPTLTLSAEASERRQNNHLPALGLEPTSAAFKDNSIGVQINIPLFEGFGRGYKVSAASSQADVKAAELARVDQQISLEIWKNYQSLNTQAANIDAAKTLLQSARRSYEVAQGRYKAGVGNILELLSAQSAVAAAEQRRIQALSGWLNARLKLAASIGKLGLWAIR